MATHSTRSIRLRRNSTGSTGGTANRPRESACSGKERVEPAMIVAILAGLLSLAPSQSHQDPRCNEWQTCRTMALAAAERGDYETFHDLAWRAVQTGPRRDPALMYLLARAQVL